MLQIHPAETYHITFGSLCSWLAWWSRIPLQNTSMKNLLEILIWQYLARSRKNSIFLCPNNTDRMETIHGNSLCSDRPPGGKRARNCLQRSFNRVSTGEEAVLPPHLGGAHVWGIGLLNSRPFLENRAEK